MAIAIGTNSTVSPRKSVSLTTLSVVGFNLVDQTESRSIIKTPFTANSVTAASPYNVFAPSPVTNTTTTVTAHNYTDTLESKSITKTPFTTTAPFAWSTIAGGGYSGIDTVVTEYADEYWITQ
jgi:hypothetical protein